jgi:hypothetical protein
VRRWTWASCSIGSFTNDLACLAVLGKSFRSEEGQNQLFRELVRDTTKLLGGFNVEDFFPFLARFGVLSKLVRDKSERLRRRWDELLDRLIEDHESKYEAPAVAASDLKDDDDFITCFALRSSGVRPYRPVRLSYFSVMEKCFSLTIF